MDKILQSLHIKLDSTMQTLTQRAIGQLLVKIIFHFNTSISEIEILQKYKAEVKDCYNKESAKEILLSLVNDDNIKFDNGKYRLSTNKKRNIEKSIQISNDRLDYIMDKYFTELYSSKEIIKECFVESITRFFESYSSEWIADINYSAQHVLSSKDNIVKTIGLRISANNKIDPRDKDSILDKFINFITTRNDVDVDGFLWEYGTSAFAAKLIKVSNTADQFSLNKFSNSKCILDTNILMNIGLEASKYSSAINSIEKAFLKLGIRVGILNITKDEYEHTIINKRNTVLRLVSKGYPNDVLKETDDQYILTALDRNCDVLEDYERFFDQIGSVPEWFDENLAIEIFDHDAELEQAIEDCQKDDSKLESLNAIYRRVCQRDKNQHSLRHDVGMIAGAEYLRTKEKTFILSQEVSVNNYSKSLPLEDGLPLSIKLETLINVLSINTDGVSDDSSYIGLFASMIRSGLTVHKELFKPEDLCYMLEKDELVTQLPADITIGIANKVHSMRVKGDNEKDVHLALTREITGGKLKIKGDLEKANLTASNEKREKERYAEQLEESKVVIYNMASDAALEDYRKELRSKIVKCVLVFILVLVFTYLLYSKLLVKTNLDDLWIVVISLGVNLLSSYLLKIQIAIKEIWLFRKDKAKFIKAKVEDKQKLKSTK